MNREEKNDHLGCGSNPTVQKLLTRIGKMPEVVHFSDFVIKINRRGKEQPRVLAITTKGVYNLMPNNYGKCKRRIAIEKLASVTISQSSDEFALHVPEEYDYRFKSAKKEKIGEILGRLFKRSMESEGKKGKLPINYISNASLKEQVVTKVEARNQSPGDVERRRQRLMAMRRGDDNDDDDDEKGDGQMTQLVEGTERVRLEDFELLKVLGRGSFGKVMQVRKKSNQKIYAMKILKKRAIIQRNQVDHTKAERKILESLQHPFLMTLRYAFQSKEKLYFVLDYIQGGELFFHLKNQRRFGEDVARVYVAEIAMALGHLHGLGIVYRDLKPENILLDDAGHVCLTDFGLSKDIAPDDKAHTFCGTPEYLAPEIVTGAGHDKAVDWWSLGILLYELTVGIPPFYSQNVNEMYNKIQHGVLRFPPFLSAECKSIMQSLLHRDPKKRLGSNGDVEELKAHPFFKSLDFVKLYKKQISPGFKPKVKSSNDTQNFDSAFTSEPVVDSLVPTSQLSQTLQNHSSAFDGFTYVAAKGSELL